MKRQRPALFELFRNAKTFLLLPILCAALSASADDSLKIWFNKPAGKWTEALPIGNGRMGAMIFGGITDERIQFNEDTLWRGKPHDYVRDGAREQLPELRRLLQEGKIQEASKLGKEKFLSDPIRQLPYQPFGDLRLHFPGHENAADYRRELDLDSALASVAYKIGDVQFVRAAYASYPDRAIVVTLTATRPGQISFTLKMDSPHTNSQTRVENPSSNLKKTFSPAHVCDLVLSGRVQNDGLRFESRVRAIAFGGKLFATNNAIAVENADSVTLQLVAATSFKTFEDISAHPAERCAKDMAALSKRKFSDVLADHLADHRKLFRRVSFNLEPNKFLPSQSSENPATPPTDARLRRLKTSGLDGDPSLVARYFQFGRYLLIASSRPGTQPANLQGIWNEELNPPWESKWTLNINCEMNYWHAEVGNLGECHQPLFDMIDDLVISGGRTAREQYGCGGWVVHHNTDLWRGSAPINNIDGIWPTGGAWLCDHLWEHFLFTGDKKFLEKRAYRPMKEASQFFVDYLIEDPKTHWLVTSPSYSPEQGTLCQGPTMDNQLVRALLNHTIRAAQILGRDKEFAAKLAKVRDRLPPNQIGKHGQLQEWLDDVDAPNNAHRHMSPLWALYPGRDITPADPKVFDAAKLLLEWRGDGSTGWSYAWRIPLWARVGDGEFAYRQLSELLKRRTLPNLFDLCGPFQIDGNFGAPAGIAEMLLQSHQSEIRNPNAEVRIIELLPALPKEWPTGSVKGLCARDGFEVDMAWENNALTRAVIRSKLGQPCAVRYGDKSIELNTKAGGEYVFDADLKRAGN